MYLGKKNCRYTFEIYIKITYNVSWQKLKKLPIYIIYKEGDDMPWYDKTVEHLESDKVYSGSCKFSFKARFTSLETFLIIYS